MREKDRNVALDPWRGVYHAIRESILSGEYEPGARLVEQQLADRFGTSRGPVRTALLELERTGLVVSIDRRGTFVRTITATDVEEIFSLSELIINFVLRRAVARIGPEDRRWLETFRNQPPAKDVDELVARSDELGRAIFRMAAHSRASEIYESLIVQAQARSLFVMSKLSEKGQPHADFDPLIDALLGGDADRAVAASHAFLEQTHEYWLERVGEASTPAESIGSSAV